MKWWLVLFIIAVGFYLFIVQSAIHRPLQADEIFFSLDAERAQFGTICVPHPPFYMDILRILHHFLSVSRENLRYFGSFCFFVNIFLVYFIAKEAFCEEKKRKVVGLLACFIYILHPLAIQGSLILDIDNTILVVLMNLFLLYFLKNAENLQIKNCIFLGLIFFACLWAKFTTPSILLLSFLFFYTLNRKKRSGIWRIFFIGIIGTVLFLFVWLTYSNKYHLFFLSVFRRSINILIRGQEESIISFVLPDSLKRLIRIILWFNPFLLALFLMALAKRAREYLREKLLRVSDLFLIYIILTSVVYLLRAITPFQFPKYHYPVLSIVVIVIASFIYNQTYQFKKNEIFFHLALFSVLAIYYAMLVGDYFYTTNFLLRENLALMPEKVTGTINLFSRQMLYYFLPFFPIAFLLKLVNKNHGKTKTICLAFIIMFFSSSLALNVIQARAKYSTNYCYGRKLNEMERLIKLFSKLRAIYPEGLIVGQEDLLYDAVGINPNLTPYLYQGTDEIGIGRDREKFIKAITDKRVICVTYSPGWNTLYAYKNIFSDKSIQGIFRNDYNFKQIGDCSVWLRKGIEKRLN